MQRALQIPNETSTYNGNNQRIYTRFHRKPQIYPSSFRMNQKKQIDNLEEENVNTLISDIYRQKKFRGMLDPTSPNNKNIFIDTDSEVQRSERIPEEYQKVHNKKSTQLLIVKTESQFPETYNSQNIFKKDGLVRGYYIKVNPNKNYNTYDYEYLKNVENKNKDIRTVFQSPEQEFDENMIYNYNQRYQTQIRPKKEGFNYLNYTDNFNNKNQDQFGKETEREDLNLLEPITKNNIYVRNNDIQMGMNPIKNKINRNQQYNRGMVYRKNNVSYSKSNVSELSIDLLNQQKRQQNENNNINNFIIKGTSSSIASPNIEYKNISNENEGEINSDESEHQNELFLYNEPDYNNYISKKTLRDEVNEKKYNNTKGQGGKVDLYYELMKNKKENNNRSINSINRKNRLYKLERIIETDENKFYSLIKLQRFIKSYLYLREICAMKIQAVWRGCNTRKIMDLYNNLDEFIYHLSKVQFNHFNNDFCFFIKQLFNIYKASISNENYNEEMNEDIDNNYDMNINNEMIDGDFIQERGAFFDPEKLETENEIALVVEGEPNDFDNNRNSKDYDKLKRDYDDLCHQYNELKNNKQNNIVITNTNKRGGQKKEKNESESTLGSIKSDYKFRFRTNSRDKTNYRGYSEIRRGSDDKEKNSFSNDYDADLDINREDDFFNQDGSYDDKDNSGSPINVRKYNYFNVNSEENSKYFDNENIKEGDMEKQNSKNIKSGKYTTKREKSKNIGINKMDKNNINSPSVGKSTSYIGHHSRTFQRNHKNTDDNLLIIPQHEEEFNIIDIKNEMAMTQINNNENEINDKIKNNEIHINNKDKNDFMKIIGDKDNEINLLQKKLNDIKNSMKKQKTFDSNLEINNNLNEINIKGNKSQFIQLNSLESKENNIYNNRLMSPRIFSRLEPEGIYNNRFKVESYDVFSKENDNIKREQRKNLLRNRSQSNSISLRNEINLKGSKLYKLKENNKLDQIIKNAEFSLINIPRREIKIVTKKILKKTNYIHSKFKDNKTMISSQNEFDIKRSTTENRMNKNRIFNSLDNKMSNENIINIKGKVRVFDNVKLNKNNMEFINLKGNPKQLRTKKLILNKSYENVINIGSQFKINGIIRLRKANIINRKTQFKIDGIKKDLSDKNCDTCDLIPKEIRITTKKVVKKTNIIKPKIKNEISYKDEISLEGLKEPMNQLNEKDYTIKKEEWKNLLKEEVQQNKFLIKRISKNIYSKFKDIKEREAKYIKNNKENIVDNSIKINIQGLEEDENIKLNIEKDLNNALLKIENVNKKNVIVKKINLKLISNKSSSQEKDNKKLVIANNWNELLKEESLQSKFTIKKKKSKPIKIEIQKNIEITLEATEDISKAKEKLMDNWKELNSEEKVEEINIEKQPQQRQIKITTKKILKKTNYIYKKFDNSNLSMINNQLNIEGKKRMPCSEFTSENSKINININNEYEQKRSLNERELKALKVNEIFINAENYKKKEIKITTKMSVTKTKFIHKKFKNNYISHENQINIKRQKPKYNKLELSIPPEENELDKLKNKLKEFEEKGVQKEEKTTDTLDLERKEIKITTKKVVKKTNILKPKFNNNSICENTQININRIQQENEEEKNNKLNIVKIINKRNKENVINKVSQIQLLQAKVQNKNYNNITENITDEKTQLSDVKLLSQKKKLLSKQKDESVSKGKKINKTKKLKTVVVYVDKKFDLKNCFDKWNHSTINIELKNALKNKIKNKKHSKSNLTSDNIEPNTENEITEENKTNEEITNFETINFEDKKNSTVNTKSTNNGKKGGKKKKIKIKYIKSNNNDNSINSSKSSENKLSISEETNSVEGTIENNTIKYRNIKSIDEDTKDMKSLESKSTKKPFILRISKVEVKKKILKSNSKTVQKEENVNIKNKFMSLYSSLITRHFFQKWHQNKANDINWMQKLMRRHIVKSLLMNKKIDKFKIHLIKYIFKN